MCTMAANCRALRTVGVNVLTSDRVITVAGMTLPDPAHVVLHATFAITLSQLATRFHTPECVKITANSTVVLRGDVIIHHLDVDGTVVIEACDGAVVGQSCFRNECWFESIDKSCVCRGEEIDCEEWWLVLPSNWP
jgi:hypothetical protein